MESFAKFLAAISLGLCLLLLSQIKISGANKMDGWDQSRNKHILQELLSRKQLWERVQQKNQDQNEDTHYKRYHKLGKKEERELGSQEVGSDEACAGGRVITCARGTAMSQGYPDSYNANSDCSWTIKAEAGKVVEIDFVDFSLEEGDCSADYVSLSERGSLVTENPIPPYCGDRIPPKFSSVGNEVEVRFVSNDEDQGRGFLFNFVTRHPVPCEDLIEIEGESGKLTSLNYPQNYLPNSHCLWRIVGPPEKKLLLTFSNISMEAARSCEWDHVKIYDGGLTQSTILGTYCGYHKPEDALQTTSNVALVLFASDGTTEDKGFDLTWESI